MNDEYLKTEPARDKYRILCKLGVNWDAETSIHYNALVDLFMAADVDSLSTEKSIGRETEIESTVNRNHVAGTMTKAREEEREEERQSQDRGYVVDANPWKAKENFRTDLSNAFSKVLDYCLKCTVIPWMKVDPEWVIMISSMYLDTAVF